jgi:cell division septation protein DedD
MKELLIKKLGQVKFGQVKFGQVRLGQVMLNRLTLNQVTMGLAFALASVAIVSSILIAPRSNEQVVELTPLQPAQELQASINPAAASQNQAATSVASSSEVREAASLEGQTSAVESVQESKIQESTLQELPVAEQAATSSSRKQPASSSTIPATIPATIPGTIPTRSTEKIAETPYLEQATSKPASSVTAFSTTATSTETSRPRASKTGTTRTEIARKTVTRSSLPLRRDSGSISVQAGAFKSLENAQKLTSRLQAAGIRAGVEKGKTMYRVLVGPYANESDARAAARGVLPLAQ